MLSIPLIDIVMAISGAIDLISPQLSNHHKSVAYIAYSISREMGLGEDDGRQILLAGLLHDCGAIRDQEKLNALRFDFASNAMERLDHGIKGWRLLKDIEDLNNAAEIIRFHHIYWDERNSAITEKSIVPMGSHILHLADRLDVLLDKNLKILNQRTFIEQVLQSNSGRMFMPDAVGAFFKLFYKPYFWFDLISPDKGDILRKFMGDGILADSEKLLALAGFINKIIDFRSSYTASHSVGVAGCAGAIASITKFSDSEVRMMVIAGLLHDLGKLAVPVEILEKKGPLDLTESNIMKCHTYYSYRILERIPQMETINKWASYHHEKLNGRGYPFGLDESDLCEGSRIMAISDVFTALTEERPYRNAMSPREAIAVMDKMAVDRHLDGDILSLLKDNIEQINNTKENAQNEALKQSDQFLYSTGEATAV